MLTDRAKSLYLFVKQQFYVGDYAPFVVYVLKLYCYDILFFGDG